MLKQHNKQGAELSLTVIIVAILVLIVLVVVVIIFSQRFSVFGRTANDCRSQGGHCVIAERQTIGGRSVSVCPAGETEISNTDCPEGQICCITVFGTGKK